LLHQEEIYGTLYIYPFDESVLKNRIEETIEDTLPETADAEFGE